MGKKMFQLTLNPSLESYCFFSVCRLKGGLVGFFVALGCNDLGRNFLVVLRIVRFLASSLAFQVSSYLGALTGFLPEAYCSLPISRETGPHAI